MSSTLQTVEEIATEKYPETDSFTLIRRRCFIEGYQEANQAAQGYRDALERIEHYATNLPNKETACVQIKHIVKQALSAAPTTQEPSKAEDRREGAVMSECYFTPSKKTTSSTICENCGQEKYLHTIGDGVKVSSVIITTQQTNVLNELEKWLVEEINDFKSGIDSSDISVANYLQLCVLSKIQTLKPKP